MNKLKDAVIEAAEWATDDTMLELYRIIERYTERPRTRRPDSKYRFFGHETAEIIAKVFTAAEIEFRLDESKTSPGVYTLSLCPDAITRLHMLTAADVRSAPRTALLIAGRAREAAEQFPEVYGTDTPDPNDVTPVDPHLVIPEITSVITGLADRDIAGTAGNSPRIISLGEIEWTLARNGVKTLNVFDKCNHILRRYTAGRYVSIGDEVLNAAVLLSAPMTYLMTRQDNNGDRNPLVGYLDFPYARERYDMPASHNVAAQYKKMCDENRPPSALLVYGNSPVLQTPEAFSVLSSKTRTLQYIRYLYTRMFNLAGLNLDVNVNLHTRLGVSGFNQAFNMDYEALDNTYDVLTSFGIADDLEDGDGNSASFYDDRYEYGDLISESPDANSFSILYYGVAVIPADKTPEVPLPEPTPVTVRSDPDTDIAANRLANEDLAAEWFMITHPSAAKDIHSAEDLSSRRILADRDALLDAVLTEGPVTKCVLTAVHLSELNSGIQTGVDNLKLKVYSGVTASADDTFDLRIGDTPEHMFNQPPKTQGKKSRHAWIYVTTNIPYHWYSELLNCAFSDGMRESDKFRRNFTASVAGHLLFGAPLPDFTVDFLTKNMPRKRHPDQSLLDAIRSTEPLSGKVCAAIETMTGHSDTLYGIIHDMSVLPTLTDNSTEVFKTDDGNIGILVGFSANVTLEARYRFRTDHGILPLTKYMATHGTKPAAWTEETGIRLNPDCNDPTDQFSALISEALKTELPLGESYPGYTETEFRGWLSPLIACFCLDMEETLDMGSFPKTWFTVAGYLGAGQDTSVVNVPDFVRI